MIEITNKIKKRLKNDLKKQVKDCVEIMQSFIFCMKEDKK